MSRAHRESERSHDHDDHHQESATTTSTTTAYDRGASDVALLAETIGDNFDRTVATHGDREALVEYDSGRRWTYAQLRADVDALAHGLIRAGHRRRATGSASGRRTARSGRSCSTPRPRSARSWSASTRPTAPTSCSTCSTSRASACWSPLASFRTSDYAAMIAEVRAGLPRARAGRPDRQRRVAGAARPRTATRRALARPAGGARPARRDQHPVHIGHHRAPQGRHAVATTTSSTTPTSSARSCRYTEADRICVPVPLFHTFGMVIGNLGRHHARRVPGLPGAVLRRRGHAGGGRGRSAARRSTGCPPCSSPSSPCSTRAARDATT